MTWFAFTSRHELKAAAELREAGFDAFALMRLDRRKVTRHPIKGKAQTRQMPIVALKGYVFACVDRPHLVRTLRHVGHPVRFCGRWEAIPERQMAWLLSPPGPLFHDTDIPRFANRPEPPKVKAGDTISTHFACEQISGEVVSVSTDGHTLVMRINRLMMGRDTLCVPVSMVEKAA
jgi:hypothetical protein